MTSRESSAHGLVVELLAVTGAVIGIGSLLYGLRGMAWIGSSMSIVVALLLLYAPVIALWRMGRPIDFVDRSWRAYLRSAVVAIVASAIIFPLFFVAAHLWQTHIWGAGPFHFRGFPGIASAFFAQAIVIALPEEFFFRGYFQSTINRVFPTRWSILGVKLGWGWIITAFVFAFAHSAITFRWWHFSIFFPALLFGYLRERTGTITAPILLHAASNIFMQWFTKCYEGTFPHL